MSFDIHLTISEDSSGGHLIASLAAQQHITPTQAVERIIDEVARREAGTSLAPDREETPAELVARLRAQNSPRMGPPAPDKSQRLLGNNRDVGRQRRVQQNYG